MATTAIHVLPCANLFGTAHLQRQCVQSHANLCAQSPADLCVRRSLCVQSLASLYAHQSLCAQSHASLCAHPHPAQRRALLSALLLSKDVDVVLLENAAATA